MNEIYLQCAILATLLGGFGFIFKIIFNIKKEINDEFKEAREKIAGLDSRLARIEGILQWLERYFFDSKEN